MKTVQPTVLLCATDIFPVTREQEIATMTENEKPDFTVVDRRQAAAAEETPPLETQTAPAPDSATTALDYDVQESAAPSASSSEGNPESESGADPFGLPNPAMLIAMAAMQTSPQELMGLLAPAFDSQARRGLGLIADPQTGELSQDLDTAKAAIDAVQFCLGKAESTLEAAEYREMMRRLNDLRLTYVAKLKTS
jgi:hypothetical protein